MACGVCFNNFKSRRDLWIECFSVKDRNSIINQVYQMVWNAGVFKIVNLARKIAPENQQGRKEVSGLLHHFIDECFFDSQFSAIRRLTDAEPSLEGRKGVFSLFSLLSDMRANVSSITRENLFLVEGKEYDFRAVEQRAAAYGLEQSRNGQSAYFIPRELDFQTLKLRHEQIDFLSGAKEDHRMPSDCVRVEIFDHLIRKIKVATGNITIYVDKNVAHAATQESRDYKNADRLLITLGYLWDAHRAICQVVNFVNLFILSGGGGGFLPIPQFDHLEFIDKPLVRPGEIKLLSDEWTEFNKETEAWGYWGIENLIQEMKKAKESVWH